MSVKSKMISAISAVCVAVTGIAFTPFSDADFSNAAESITDSMEWGAMEIGGGGFVSGIVTGQEVMYARTDVGGAYKYNYDTSSWDQLFAFLNDADRGFLSVDSMCVDPTDDDTVYFLCGCAYFSSERTVIFKTTDGGKTFKEIDVTDLIKVHGNGYGRQCGEAIAVDPENPDIIYCGGDTDGLIMSKDGGETWGYVDSFNDLGLFTYEVKWPTWTETIEKTTVGTDYSNSNGVATIAIEDGKVFVGVSDNTIGNNVYVADVNKDNWTPLSDELPTDSFPSRINKDADGNLLISYIGNLSFGATGGGVYKYDIASDTVTDISPTGNSFGACVSLPNDSDTLVATTCGVWSAQLWTDHDWEDEKVCYGDWFYRSTDGGTTWEAIVPGQAKYWDGPLQADYLQDGGFSWVRNKAIHWVGTIVLDPKNSDRVLITSGNGVFASDNIWSELPQYYFHPNGIEEVVALDMVSVPGGNEYSAIGDYDGFIHTDVDVQGTQYAPNIGSTGAIAYCPQNPDVMVRIANGDNNVAPGLYSLDGGVTWTKMDCSSGGKAAITQLDKDTYRIFQTATGGCKYSDDFGATWNNISLSGLYYNCTPYPFVDLENPENVYIYGYSQAANQWDTTPTSYKLYVSTDYGKTFSAPTDIATYDYCDAATRVAYLGDGNIALAAGWYGLYTAEAGGKNITSKDVFYCKTVGYGAPEKEGGMNTLYMYGKPEETDAEGIYRSTDGGDTWVCINTDNLYGGTGNGNFLVGDMNEFGTVYMSTVGCGIVYGKIASDVPVTVLYGDANVSGKVDIADVVAVRRYLVNAEKYPLSAQGMLNADVQSNGGGVNAQDAVAIQKYTLGIIKTLPV